VILKRVRGMFASGGAATAPDASDERLRGRTYAVPFDEVWECSVRLAGGGLSGWRVLEADDVAGVLRAAQRGRLRRAERAATVRIGFDADAQTRVDLDIAGAPGGPDFGAAARAIHRFCRALDRELIRRRGESTQGPIRLDA